MQFISLILLPILIIYSNASIVYPTDRSKEEFDWSLTKVILKNECTGQNECNVMLSPYVTKLSLFLLKDAIAENSESHNELSILLPELNRYHEFYYWMETVKSLKEKNENNYVLMGSLIGLAKGSSVRGSYRQKAKDLYNSEVQTYDFDRTNETVKILNDYVSKKTGGHVKDIVTPDLINGAKAIILNTIYFKAEWEIGFQTTKKGKFSVGNNKHIETAYMQTIETFHYAESKTLDSQLIRMNYNGNKYAMYIVLPKKVDGLQKVINSLDANILENEISKMKETSMKLTIPKFKFESSFSLAKHLQKLGIKKIFTSEANIQLIKSSGSALEVKDVIQKMGIEVNQSGTEAYGAIATPLGNKMLDSDKPIDVTVDHSFLFFIKDVTTGAVLFTGKVTKPEY